MGGEVVDEKKMKQKRVRILQAGENTEKEKEEGRKNEEVKEEKDEG